MRKFKNDKTMVTKEEFARANVGHSFMMVCPECGREDNCIAIKSKGSYRDKNDEWLPRWVPGELCTACAGYRAKGDETLAGMGMIMCEDKLKAFIGIEEHKYDTLIEMPPEVNPDGIKWHHGVELLAEEVEDGLKIIGVKAAT